MPKVFNRDVKLSGRVKSGVRIYTTDNSGKVLLCSGTVVPTGAGYAKGCLFMKTDVATGSKGLYENQGTTASASFNVIGDITAAEIGTDAVTTVKILNANVTLAKLAAGITPSHVVKYAGKITWTGSGASLATTVTGVAATDIVVATIQTAPTQAASLVTAAPTTDTITLVLSTANTSNNAVIAYQVLRAAA